MFAEDLVIMIVITEQWPYRSSYILQVIDDANQREESGLKNECIKAKTSILEIYM